ncbi:hypothetical protein TNCV_2751011 [Trichonephila clavipes]|nr:hypothetical protein TNCV_2751011 [Trichonephila clavipes]
MTLEKGVAVKDRKTACGVYEDKKQNVYVAFYLASRRTTSHHSRGLRNLQPKQSSLAFSGRSTVPVYPLGVWGGRTGARKSWTFWL